MNGSKGQEWLCHIVWLHAACKLARVMCFVMLVIGSEDRPDKPKLGAFAAYATVLFIAHLNAGKRRMLCRRLRADNQHHKAFASTIPVSAGIKCLAAANRRQSLRAGGIFTSSCFLIAGFEAQVLVLPHIVRHAFTDHAFWTTHDMMMHSMPTCSWQILVLVVLDSMAFTPPTTAPVHSPLATPTAPIQARFSVQTTRKLDLPYQPHNQPCYRQHGRLIAVMCMR